MAAFTEFTNLATISVPNTIDQYPTEVSCGNVDISTENCEKGYSEVSRNDSRVGSAVLVQDINHTQGTTVSFYNLQYTVEPKKRRKKCKKVIVKGIR